MTRINGNISVSIQVESNYDSNFKELPSKVWWQSIDSGRRERPVTHEVLLGTIVEVADDDFNFTYVAKTNRGVEKSGLTYNEALSFLISPK